MSDFKIWVNESELAKEIPVKTNIVLFEGTSSMEGLRARVDDGLDIPETQLSKKTPFSLEAGGKIIGKGKIVKKGGKHYFKLIETLKQKGEE